MRYKLILLLMVMLALLISCSDKVENVLVVNQREVGAKIILKLPIWKCLKQNWMLYMAKISGWLGVSILSMKCISLVLIWL